MDPEHGLGAAWSRVLALAKAHPEASGPACGAAGAGLATPTEPAESAALNPPSTLERKRVQSRLGGFDSSKSVAWQEFCTRFGKSLNHTELLSVAEVIASQIGVRVDREAKRRKEVLIKWFDENYLAIAPILPRLKLENADGKMMTGVPDALC
jgi:hypothetical protein